MMPGQQHEPPNRPSARVPDWAAAATEARQRRDDAAKQRAAELQQQRRQARGAAAAWSPQYEIRVLAGVLGKAAGVLTPDVPAPSAPPPPSLFRWMTGQPVRRRRIPSPPSPGEPPDMAQQNAGSTRWTLLERAQDRTW